MSINVAESNKVGITAVGGDCKDKTVKKLPTKNLNKGAEYLTSKARLAFI